MSIRHENFGINSATFYDRTTLVPFGKLDILESASLSLGAEFAENDGGPSRFKWNSSVNVMSAEFALTTKEFPSFLYNLFLGAPVTTVTSTVNILQNTLSAVITDVSATTPTDLKFGLYVLRRAPEADAIAVYISTDQQRFRGTEIENIDANLRIATIAKPQTGTTFEIPNTGLTVTFDDAVDFNEAGLGNNFITIQVIPNVTDTFELDFGRIGQSDQFRKVGIFLTSESSQDNALITIQLDRVTIGGLPLTLTKGEYRTADLTGMANYCEDNRRVGKFIATRIAS